MKKILFTLAAVIFVTTLFFNQTSTAQNTKLLATDPPIITFPPRTINVKSTTPVMNLYITETMIPTKLV